jgi:nucleoside-diphosphate-sugar epimerase
MQVFLTGANGWIGSVVAQELLDAGYSGSGSYDRPKRARRSPPGV